MGVDELIEEYNELINSSVQNALNAPNRAFGGVLRSQKGTFVEYLGATLVKLAWNNKGGNMGKLRIDKKKIPIMIDQNYVESLSKDVYDVLDVTEYKYGLSVDIHVFIDDKLVLGIECKAYAENAMIKRILFDFYLLKTVKSDMKCCLLQLESQLGGDYSDLSVVEHKGSESTHTLMSYFPNVDLNIITLLYGERKVDRPIHTKGFHKQLTKESLERALSTLEELLPNPA
ncbi:MAG: hypothetical protein K8823_1631 [Cenarchaeum symbiont of Oopsacas minuta]|nr:hypothetical protein [Cenarchaeum symbiont of Oopsacas minuta]